MGFSLLAAGACGPTNSEFMSPAPEDELASDESGGSFGKPGGATALTGVCGDAFVAAGEQCDDGNREPGDGCSGKCRFESGAIVWTSPAVAPIEDLWQTDDGYLAAAHGRGLLALYDRDGAPRWQRWFASDSTTADRRDTTYSRVVGLPGGDLVAVGTENEAEFSEKLRGRLLRVSPVVTSLDTGASAGVPVWEHLLPEGVFSGLTVDRDGDIYVAGRDEHTGSFVRRYDIDGNLVWEVTPACAPWNLALDEQGRLGGICIADDGSPKITRQDPATGLSESTLDLPGSLLPLSRDQQAAGFVEPKIAFASDGSTLIAAFGNASNPGVTVMRLEQGGETRWMASLALMNPGAVAEVGPGRVYVGGFAGVGSSDAPGRDNLYTVDDRGELVGATTIRDAARTQAVTDVEIGPEGFVYVATAADSGTLVKIAP